MEDKAQILADLQEIGCLHLIPLKPSGDPIAEGGPSSRSRDALNFLLNCPRRRRQVRDPSKFDPLKVEHRALDLRESIQTLEDERDFLKERIANLRPWGEFVFPSLEELGNVRLWFYLVPRNQMEKVEAAGLIWEVVLRDNRFSYVVVLSEGEPEGMPVPRVRTGSISLPELEDRLEEVELVLEDLQAERAGLTRWCYLFARGIHRLEDQAAVEQAARQTYDASPVFALQAWAPRENVAELREYAAGKMVVLEVADPDPGEIPPTLMHNPRLLAGGQDLVSFYTTPQYWLWDPSVIVFFSFAVFFAMIFADAGYSAALGLILAALWKWMGRTDSRRRFRALLATLVGAGVAYGVMVGSYFGVAPAEGSLPAGLKVLDIMDFDTMMLLSIMTGVFHLVLANAVTAWHWRRSARAVVPAAWVFIFLGAASVWLGYSGGQAAGFLKTVGVAAMGVGLGAVLFFTSVEGPLWQRLLRGIQGFTRLSNAFGDSLSYLRLFALGLASASLASTFNDLAGQVRASVPGIGFLFALLIILLGHGLNFLLALSSGFIHGLRLNFIEFFNWSISEEGDSFKAFSRKERVPWRTWS
ncbi:MAG: hypothetical protein JRJ26_08765 [Deltaproteobacteria bacterium]|nr:hypothetical protein [Deltaproteobacteria bacterium]